MEWPRSFRRSRGSATIRRASSCAALRRRSRPLWTTPCGAGWGISLPTGVKPVMSRMLNGHAVSPLPWREATIAVAGVSRAAIARRPQSSIRPLGLARGPRAVPHYDGPDTAARHKRRALPVCRIVLAPDIGVVSNVATPVARRLRSTCQKRSGIVVAAKEEIRACISAAVAFSLATNAHDAGRLQLIARCSGCAGNFA
jgi:hypothetical protein